MEKLKGLQKHRLVLLLGILVALVFFYFGVNTWMESQEKRVAPPPVVRSKPPVEIKPESKPIKPVEPKPIEKPIEKVAKPIPEVKPPQPKPQPQTPPPQAVAQKPKEETKPPQQKPEPKKVVKEQPKTEEKKVEQKVAKAAPEKEKKAPAQLRDYVVQIGAFKIKENADKSLNLAKEKGLEAFIIEEDGLYKVRIRVKAENPISALRKVRTSFKNAFVVQR
ncbi:DedD protein [Hydrogenivirga caldilitoris]|uniref:DedD protein n=1 Tax=Hydrogenivirga caldilitoris TaxID=246264 RepID=A0A497XLU2_9AQUI|nr:SPOR domain-containing protein [Hydrogenivirga caldilitoris]RLJ69846.1 DedD protein [Hydrogenivirga caldilitoris]